MKKRLFSVPGATALMMTVALLGMSLPASAAALFTLKGESPQAKLESESEVRVSVLGWTADEQAKAVADEYQRYQQSQDHAAFQTFLQSQETRGYLFTKEATGHTIKYAWQDADSAGKRMVFLVTPALKTRNPYMWKTPNDDPAPFSLIELRFEGEEAVMKSSLGAPIAVNAQGQLQLQDFDGATEFATLRDDTPYYLKKAG
jgi:hypothetical protein